MAHRRRCVPLPGEIIHQILRRGLGLGEFATIGTYFIAEALDLCREPLESHLDDLFQFCFLSLLRVAQLLHEPTGDAVV